MMEIDWKEQKEGFSGDGNVLYLDRQLQGVNNMSELTELYT